MKNFISILLLAAITTLSVYAQGQISFEYDSLGIIYLADDGDLVINNRIINNTSDTLEIKWVKFNENILSSWDGISICVVECYVPSVSEKIEYLPSDSFLSFDVHFLVNGYEGEGFVDAYVFVVGDSANTVVFSEYYGKAEGFKTSTPFVQNTKLKIKVYPNPARSYLIIKNLPTNKDVTIEAYSILGKKMISTKVNVAENPFGLGEYRLNLETLPRGVYMIRVYDDHMNVIHSESISRIKS